MRPLKSFLPQDCLFFFRVALCRTCSRCTRSLSPYLVVGLPYPCIPVVFLLCQDPNVLLHLKPGQNSQLAGLLNLNVITITHEPSVKTTLTPLPVPSPKLIILVPSAPYWQPGSKTAPFPSNFHTLHVLTDHKPCQWPSLNHLQLLQGQSLLPGSLLWPWLLRVRLTY